MGDRLSTMKVIAAYLLAVTGGNASPNVADVKKILTSAGVELSDDESKRLEGLVEEMAGQSAEEGLAKGHELLKTVPMGGGGGAAAAPGAATGGAGGDAGGAAEEKKEESDDDDDGANMAGGGLFGDDGGDDY